MILPTMQLSIRRPLTVLLNWLTEPDEETLPVYKKNPPKPEPVREIVIVGFKDGQQTYEVLEVQSPR